MLTIIKQALKNTPLLNEKIARLGAKTRSLRGAAARTSGYNAEDAAAAWLVAKGLILVERNVRYTFGEIDIVAWHGAVLVLVEVRMRSHARFGDAAASITPRKQARMWAAGEAYAAQFSSPPPMRIDVLAYTAQNPEPNWIQNALG